MRIHIYLIYFPTSKKCYIGQTAYLEKRMAIHLVSKYPVGSALRKYDDWHVSILHTCKFRDEANRTEIEEIRNFNSVAPNGYNLTAGGGGSFNPSEETRKRMSESHIGSKCPSVTKRNLENNSMKNPKMAAKKAKTLIGNQFAKGKHWKNPGASRRITKRNKENNPSKNPITVLKQRRTKLRNRIAKLEQDL